MNEPDSLGDIQRRGRAKSGMFYDDGPPEQPEAKPLDADGFLRHAGAHYGRLTGKPATEVEVAAMKQLIREGFEVSGLNDLEAERLSTAVHNRVSEMRYFGAAVDGATPEEARVTRAMAELKDAERGMSTMPDGPTAYEARLQQELDRPGISREELARELHRARG